MEENIAILMADLSGYTALTETHGAVSAADLIDRYLEIVEDCLLEDCRLCERTGDEVMIVSSSPESLLNTTFRIMNVTSREDNFLQVHGGLHYGKLLKRRNSYFGSAINLASRIAAKASAGTFWCSGEFRNAVSDKYLMSFHAKGLHSFKNISGQQEVYELKNENKGTLIIDSICRMVILDTDKAVRHPHVEEIYFCSMGCLEIYLKNQSGEQSAD